MKNTGRLMIVIAVLVLPVVFACQARKPDITVQLPAAETAEDEALSKAVRERLSADKKLDLSGVKVVSNSGTVYLTGNVGSLDARQQAIKLAWEVGGVQNVINTLQVEQ